MRNGVFSLRTEITINRHFERARTDRRGTTEDWGVDWVEMERDETEIPHRILGANTDLRVSAVALFVLPAGMPFAVGRIQYSGRERTRICMLR